MKARIFRVQWVTNNRNQDAYFETEEATERFAANMRLGRVEAVVFQAGVEA